MQMVRDLETPGKGVHVSMWQDMWNLVVKVVVMAAGASTVCTKLQPRILDLDSCILRTR